MKTGQEERDRERRRISQRKELYVWGAGGRERGEPRAEGQVEKWSQRLGVGRAGNSRDS